MCSCVAVYMLKYNRHVCMENTMVLCFMHKTIVELIFMWVCLTLGADVAINEPCSFMFEGEFYYHALTECYICEKLQYFNILVKLSAN